MVLSTLSASSFGAGVAGPVPSAIDWITGTLIGNLALTLCELAVAYVGLLMLTGRLAVRAGLRVVLGCFILLGAPLIASAFVGFGQVQSNTPLPVPTTLASEDQRPELPPSDHDPYAGASLRSE